MRLFDVNWMRVLVTAIVGVGLYFAFALVSGLYQVTAFSVALLLAGAVGAFPGHDTDVIYQGGWTAALIAFGALVALPTAYVVTGRVESGYVTMTISWLIVSAIVFVPIIGIGGGVAGWIGNRIAN